MGKRFALPIKKKLPRAKRAKTRESVKDLAVLMSTATDASSSTTNSTVVTPFVEEHSEDVVSSVTTAVGDRISSTRVAK